MYPKITKYNFKSQVKILYMKIKLDYELQTQDRYKSQKNKFDFF